MSGAFKVYDHYKRPFLKGEKLFQKRGDNSKEVTYLCPLPNKMSTVINDKGLIECAMDFELSRIDATET